MRQIIIGGNSNPLNDTTTEYNTISGGSSWLSEMPWRAQVISTPGVLKRLFVKLSAAPGAGKSYTFTLLRNDFAQDLSVTISETDTQGSDMANSVPVYPGDRLTLRVAPSGTPAVGSARWSLVFEGSNNKESLILGASAAFTDQTTYSAIAHGASTSSTDESNCYQVIPADGVIKNLFVSLTSPPGTSPDAYRFTLRKNGVSTSLTVTITGFNLTGVDITNEVSVVAGDYVSMMIEPLEVPANEPIVHWGLTFKADADGYSLLLGQSSDTPSTGAAEYNYLTTTAHGSIWSATESNYYQLGQAYAGAILKRLYVKLSAAPGTDKSYRLMVRKNGEDTSLYVTISGAGTSGADWNQTVSLASWDLLDIACIPTGTPTAAKVYWGVGCYIGPPQVGVTHDIVLEKADGTRRGFMIIPGSERKQPVNQFAPVIANVSDPMFAEGVWRSWSMEKFFGGCGDLEWENRESFLRSNLVETRHERGLSLASDIESSDADVDVLKYIDVTGPKGTEVVANGKFPTWNGDPASWTDVDGDSAKEVSDPNVHSAPYSNRFDPSAASGYPYQDVVTVASELYDVVVWCKILYADKISIVIKDVTSQNTLASTDGYSKQWTEYKLRFTAESTGTQIRLVTYADAAFWDDVSIKSVQDYEGCMALCASGNKVRIFRSGTWADEKTGLAADCTDGATFDAYTYVAIGPDNNGQKVTGGTWSEWNKQAVLCLAYREYFCWTKENKLYYHEDPSDASPNEIEVGSSDCDITGICIYAGYLYMGKYDGTIWRWDGTTLTEVEHLKGRNSEKNFHFMCVHEGYLFFNVGRDIYQYSANAIVKITPILAGSSDAEKYGFGIPVAFQSVGGYLYVAFDDGEGLYPYVLAYDRTRSAWHIVYKGAVGETMYGLGHSPLDSYLWINDGASRYQRLTPDSDRIYANYAESGEFITSKFKGSFPFQPKCYADITLKARDCTGLTGERVAVYYDLNSSGSWTLLGTVIQDGRTKFQLDTTYGGKEGYEVQLRLLLARTAGDANNDKSPIVESFHVAFMDRPEPVYQYRLIARLAEDLVLRDGSAETYTVAELKTHIEECYESVVPILYRPRIGSVQWVFMRSFVALEPREGFEEEDHREMQYDIQMIDAVTSGMGEVA